MQAYLNNPKLKADFIKELEWHAEQDAFIQGRYGTGEGEDFKGCAVGCSINSLNRLHGTDIATSDHAAAYYAAHVAALAAYSIGEGVKTDAK